VQLPASDFSQYGTNLTETGDIFPLMAKIMHNTVEQPLPQTPSDSVDTDTLHASFSIIYDTPEDPLDAGQSDPTPGKALPLSQADREAAGLASTLPQASKEQLSRDSEKMSKNNHDRPSRRLMMEAAEAAEKALAVEVEEVDQNSPACNPQLHLAPAISGHPTVRQLLLEDSPIPALGATWPAPRDPRPFLLKLNARVREERASQTA
jgi:hypothetical protein